MDQESWNRALLALAVVLVAGGVFALPLVRARRRWGVWAVAFRRGGDVRELASASALALFFAGWMSFLLARVADVPAVGRLVWPLPAGLAWGGWALAAGGLGIIAAAQAQMGPSWRIGIDARPTALVTRGLFRVSRNPIYLGLLLLLGGLALVTLGPASALGWLATAAVVGVQARLEEKHLLALHGDAYLAYGARVGRFLPWFGRLVSPSEIAAAISSGRP
jgi:protein-S-isoprenylcysteine O-methyltransferase Ste14